MRVRLDDIKVGDYYQMKRVAFIVVQKEQVSGLTFPLYHLYFVRHRREAGKLVPFSPSTLTMLLEHWY